MPLRRRVEDEPELPIEDIADQSEDELQEYQERLLQLRREQELMERKARELENLRQRKQEFLQGQRQMRESLTRAITILERAQHDARRQMEEFFQTCKTLQEHLNRLEALNPHEWDPHDLDQRLTQALAIVDDARAVFASSRARIDAISGQDLAQPESGATNDFDESEDERPSAELVPFSELVRRGFALSLPLILTLVALALWLSFR